MTLVFFQTRFAHRSFVLLVYASLFFCQRSKTLDSRFDKPFDPPRSKAYLEKLSRLLLRPNCQIRQVTPFFFLPMQNFAGCATGSCKIISIFLNEVAAIPYFILHKIDFLFSQLSHYFSHVEKVCCLFRSMFTFCLF